MIINIRGTSGSGKTTLARRVMAHYSADLPVRGEAGGRERVVGHQLDGYASGRSLFVMGNYSGPKTGGCDNFSWKGAADWLMPEITARAKQGDLLFEGLLVGQYGFERWLQLRRDVGRENLHIIYLDTPLQQCLASVAARRAEREAETGKVLGPLDPTQTTEKWEAAQKAYRKFRDGEFQVELLEREAAYARVCSLLGVSP